MPARVRNLDLGRNAGSRSDAARRSRSMSRSTRSAASSSSGCASTTPTRSSASGSTCCSRRCCASFGIVWFVRLGRRPSLAGARLRPGTSQGSSRIGTGYASVPYGVTPVTTTIPPPPTAARARSGASQDLRHGRNRSARARRDRASSSSSRDYTAIMGPSGSGKSTLLHCLAGLDTLTSGHVFLGDLEISALVGEGAHARSDATGIGFIFQTYNLIPTLDARWRTSRFRWRSPVATPTRRGSTRSSTSSDCATASTHRPSELSGGQQQRVAVARALASRPDIIFADEPTGNLDSRASAEILDFMRKAVDEFGQTIVMVTHDPGAACVRRPGRVPRRRPHRRRDHRSHARRDPRQDAQAGRRVAAMWKVTRKGLLGEQVPLRAHRDRGHPRRRVHVGHVGAHRDDPADVRRPVRRTSTRAPTRSVRAPEVLESDFGSGRNDRTFRASLARRRAAGARRRGRRRQRAAPSYAQIVDKNGKAIGDPAQGPPTLGLGVEAEPDAQPVPHRRRAGRPQRDDEIVIDRHSADKGNFKVGDRVTVLTTKRPQKYTIVGIARFGTADSLPGASISAVHDAEAQRIANSVGQFGEITVRRQAGREAGSRCRHDIQQTLAEHGDAKVEVITGEEITKENQDAIHKAARVSSTSRSAIFGVIALVVGAFIIYNTFSIIVAQRSARDGACCARSARASARCSSRSSANRSSSASLASVIGVVAGHRVSRSDCSALMSAVGIRPAGTGVARDPAERGHRRAASSARSSRWCRAIVPARRRARIPPIAAMRDCRARAAAEPARRDLRRWRVLLVSASP